MSGEWTDSPTEDTMKKLLCLVLVTLLTFALSSPALAQSADDPSVRWERLRWYTHRDTVEVSTRSGEKFKGEITGVTSDDLTIETKKGAHTIARSDVLEVKTVRSRGKIAGWTMVGLGAGADVGAIAGGVKNGLADVPNRQAKDIGTGAAIGAGIGTLLGYFKGRSTAAPSLVLYRAP